MWCSGRVAALMLLACLCAPSLFSQDWIKTGTGLGVEKVRLAVSDFKAASDPQTAALL
jgi:TolB protein